MPHRHFETYHQLHVNYYQRLQESSASFHLPPNNKILLNFAEWVEHQPGGNKCFTLCDIKSGKYYKWHLVKEIFGYDEQEFTAEAVNNFGELKLIHPDHIEHKKRYSYLIIEILKSKIEFNIRMDSYSIIFKLKHKNGGYLPVKRKSIIFQIASESEMLSRLDEWEILSRVEGDYVYPEISMTDTQKTDELNGLMYLMNCEELDIHFEPRHRKVLHYKLKGLKERDIAYKLTVNDGTIENYFNEVSKLIRDALENNSLSGVMKIKIAAKTWGLYPVPRTLLK